MQVTFKCNRYGFNGQAKPATSNLKEKESENENPKQ
jgi:hypothetical protein